MTLLEKQQEFAQRVAVFLLWLSKNGYSVTLGEAWRSDAEAKINAAEHIGIADSLHRLRLAIDLNLFKGGRFLSATADYQAAGAAWEALSTTEALGCWGGTWGDADHFSIEYGGLK